MRKEHLYWQPLHCLKPWICTSLSAAVETSRARAVTANWWALLTTASRPRRVYGSNWGLHPSLPLIPITGCLSQIVKILDVCTIQNHCTCTQTHPGSNELVFGPRQTGPGQSWLPLPRARELLPSQPATWEPFFPLMISALQQEGSLNLTRKVFEVLPKPDLYELQSIRHIRH